MRCDRVAKGVIQASRNVEINVPVVVRLQGTNAKKAEDILNQSEFEFIVANDFKDAAEKVVAAIG